MENFKEVTLLQRKNSCPILISAQDGKRFQIYDRELRKKEFMTKKNQVVSAPPLYYPYRDLEMEVEESAINPKVFMTI